MVADLEEITSSKRNHRIRDKQQQVLFNTLKDWLPAETIIEETRNGKYSITIASATLSIDRIVIPKDCILELTFSGMDYAIIIKQLVAFSKMEADEAVCVNLEENQSPKFANTPRFRTGVPVIPMLFTWVEQIVAVRIMKGLPVDINLTVSQRTMPFRAVIRDKLFKIWTRTV